LISYPRIARSAVARSLEIGNTAATPARSMIR
jgi:hypothetical protein